MKKHLTIVLALPSPYLGNCHVCPPPLTKILNETLHGVEYRNSGIILQMDWETNTSHAECGQLSGECSLLGACVY